MSRGTASLAVAIMRLAAWLMPAPLGPWAKAMRAELDEISGAGATLSFAIGCLGVALTQAAQAHLLHPLGLPLLDARTSNDLEGTDMNLGERLLGHPARLTGVCAVIAVGLGLAYLSAAGAPPSYLAVNVGALLIGFTLVAIVRLVERTAAVSAGAAGLAAGITLLATSLLGAAAEGASRWIAIGPLFVQPSLILLPVMMMAFTRRRDLLSTAGIVAAAAALALQPDRAMAGALFAGLLALSLVRRGPQVVIALIAAGVGFAVTLMRPDELPAMRYVDQILYSSFMVSPLAGLAVIGGVLLMLVPAVTGLRRDPDHRDLYVAFGATWLAIIAAAALGNYPTPLVGYGGSAIIGYVLSLLGLPKRESVASTHVAADTERNDERSVQVERIICLRRSAA